MNKAEKKEFIIKRAEELARSGEYNDYMSIEIALRGEGFPEARSILHSRSLRQELTEIIQQAKSSE